MTKLVPIMMIVLMTTTAICAAQDVRIHSATDIAHEFTFYWDGRFATQYTAADGGVEYPPVGQLGGCGARAIHRTQQHPATPRTEDPRAKDRKPVPPLTTIESRNAP